MSCVFYKSFLRFTENIKKIENALWQNFMDKLRTRQNVASLRQKMNEYNVQDFILNWCYGFHRLSDWMEGSQDQGSPTRCSLHQRNHPRDRPRNADRSWHSDKRCSRNRPSHWLLVAQFAHAAHCEMAAVSPHCDLTSNQRQHRDETSIRSMIIWLESQVHFRWSVSTINFPCRQRERKIHTTRWRTTVRHFVSVV